MAATGNCHYINFFCVTILPKKGHSTPPPRRDRLACPYKSNLHYAFHTCIITPVFCLCVFCILLFLFALCSLYFFFSLNQSLSLFVMSDIFCNNLYNLTVYLDKNHSFFRRLKCVNIEELQLFLF